MAITGEQLDEINERIHDKWSFDSDDVEVILVNSELHICIDTVLPYDQLAGIAAIVEEYV